MELKKCVDLYGAGYVDDRQHFVEMLRQYREDPELQYEDSFLKAYYECFQLETRKKPFLYWEKHRVESGWIGLPWFGDKQKVVFVQEQETRPGETIISARSDEFGHAEFGRLIRHYELFKEGYQRNIFRRLYQWYCSLKGRLPLCRLGRAHRVA